MDKEELRVSKIEAGTVIDHIPPGRALTVLEILGIDQETSETVSVLMNVPSGRYGEKDIVKIEGRELREDEVNKIGLVAPNATINVIEDYKVVEKRVVELPDVIEGVVDCSNPACITNTSEPATPKFWVVNKNPIRLRCSYCERITEEEALFKQFSE
ncbi:aspartate carbamoyltransferase [candidate division MSBL1 archaeon SCGC-AAA259I09]|uniref:Aspartate carbamoyltransferase regulatory chain n=1 Tax=candidate division MSBL1 archaeon SCGC-AAA259I09 TaxID=1698267 RepID=A0A133UL72_9EURY|nr:aspartate carbamoyltransferase [candidate division MSBL1 archaeon SCGC-AAA259I09]